VLRGITLKSRVLYFAARFKKAAQFKKKVDALFLALGAG